MRTRRPEGVCRSLSTFSGRGRPKHDTKPIRPMTMTESPFKLVAPFPPRGDQPVAIETLLQSIRSGHRHQTLLGATGTGKTFTMAQVIAQLGRPALVISPNKTLA